MEPYEFTDYAGDRLRVRPRLDLPEAAAVIETTFRDTEDGQPVVVPAHRLAEVVAAMYEAAGQPVPDLPVIHDEAQVVSLASLIGSALSGACRDAGHLPVSAYADAARALLSHGVRLPEAR